MQELYNTMFQDKVYLKIVRITWHLVKSSPCHSLLSVHSSQIVQKEVIKRHYLFTSSARHYAEVTTVGDTGDRLH